MAGQTKTYVKAGILAVGAIAAVVLFTTHPILSVIIAVVGGAYWLIDSGKVGI